MSKLQPKFILVLLIALISGCQSIGTIQGTSEGSPIQLDYQQGFLENDGLLTQVSEFNFIN